MRLKYWQSVYSPSGRRGSVQRDTERYCASTRHRYWMRTQMPRPEWTVVIVAGVCCKPRGALPWRMKLKWKLLLPSKSVCVVRVFPRFRFEHTEHLENGRNGWEWKTCLELKEMQRIFGGICSIISELNICLVLTVCPWRKTIFRRNHGPVISSRMIYGFAVAEQWPGQFVPNTFQGTFACPSFPGSSEYYHKAFPCYCSRFFLRCTSKNLSLRAGDYGGNTFWLWLSPRPGRCQSLEVGSLSPSGLCNFALLCLHPKLDFQVIRVKGKQHVPVRKCPETGYKSGLLLMLDVLVGCKDIFWQDFFTVDLKCLPLLFMSLYCSGFCTIRGMKVFNF